MRLALRVELDVITLCLVTGYYFRHQVAQMRLLHLEGVRGSKRLRTRASFDSKLNNRLGIESHMFTILPSLQSLEFFLPSTILWTSSLVKSACFRTTNAFGSSPDAWSGMPTTPTSSTFGCFSMTDSNSAGETLVRNWCFGERSVVIDSQSRSGVIITSIAILHIARHFRYIVNILSSDREA